MKEMINIQLQKSYQTDLPLLESFIDEMVCIPVGWWVGESERDILLIQ